MTEKHQRINELLPWLVNGTLDSAEAEEVRDHVANCVACRAELKRLGELRSAVHAEGHPGVDLERGLQGLRRQVSRDRRPTSGSAAPRRRWGLVRWVLVGQTAALALAVGLLLAPDHRGAPPSAAFRTLAAPGPTLAGAGPRLRVLFSEGATEQEIRRLLHEIRGRIVDGPSPMGLYAIELAGDPADSASLEELVDSLRDRPGIRFVELSSEGSRP